MEELTSITITEASKENPLNKIMNAAQSAAEKIKESTSMEAGNEIFQQSLIEIADIPSDNFTPIAQ